MLCNLHITVCLKIFFKEKISLQIMFFFWDVSVGKKMLTVVENEKGAEITNQKLSDIFYDVGLNYCEESYQALGFPKYAKDDATGAKITNLSDKSGRKKKVRKSMKKSLLPPLTIGFLKFIDIPFCCITVTFTENDAKFSELPRSLDPWKWYPMKTIGEFRDFIWRTFTILEQAKYPDLHRTNPVELYLLGVPLQPKHDATKITNVFKMEFTCHVKNPAIEERIHREILAPFVPVNSYALFHYREFNATEAKKHLSQDKYRYPSRATSAILGFRILAQVPGYYLSIKLFEAKQLNWMRGVTHPTKYYKLNMDGTFDIYCHRYEDEKDDLEMQVRHKTCEYLLLSDTKWKRHQECIICFEAKLLVLNYPCMHVCCCENCYTKLLQKRCPQCQSIIKEIRQCISI